MATRDGISAPASTFWTLGAGARFVFFQPVLLAYWRAYAFTLDSYWVIGGLLCGFLLRFEFLGGAVEKLIRALELFVFVYVTWSCIKLILRW
ncbi:MAG: hypothetical protein DMG58_00360 [Acidobacteria bacterium]|nr:MAG: hypothetical protein DMG58_00360 [Acidobacteriota bacterium]